MANSSNDKHAKGKNTTKKSQVRNKWNLIKIAFQTVMLIWFVSKSEKAKSEDKKKEIGEGIGVEKWITSLCLFFSFSRFFSLTMLLLSVGQYCEKRLDFGRTSRFVYSSVWKLCPWQHPLFFLWTFNYCRSMIFAVVNCPIALVTHLSFFPTLLLLPVLLITEVSVEETVYYPFFLFIFVLV